MGLEGQVGDGFEFAEVLAGPGVLDAVGGVVEAIDLEAAVDDHLGLAHVEERERD